MLASRRALAALRSLSKSPSKPISTSLSDSSQSCRDATASDPLKGRFQLRRKNAAIPRLVTSLGPPFPKSVSNHDIHTLFFRNYTTPETMAATESHQNMRSSHFTNADPPRANVEASSSSNTPPKVLLPLSGGDAPEPSPVSAVAKKIVFNDLRRPHEWYPLARSMKRKIIMHVGPTNSGKTHSALEALKRAKKGVYCGPLRLLAEQVFEKLNTEGVPCNLVTGEKIIELDRVDEATRLTLAKGGDEAMASLFALYTGATMGNPEATTAFGSNVDSTQTSSGTGSSSSPSGADTFMFADEPNHTLPPVRHVSCTVEMADVRTKFEVALIDEYQLIGDESRGWAWTRALLGLPASEIHLCGDTSGIQLVKDLLLPTGDEVEVREYERLSPLVVAKSSLGSAHGKSSSDKDHEHTPRGRHTFGAPLSSAWVHHLKPGDAVIVFSRKSVFQHKKLIESTLGRKVSVVYGSLPPETRTQQAKRFNDPESDSNILVATDAIGLGLNLNIQRIIFSTLQKFDGIEMRDLRPPEVRQIGGRAGRYGSLFPKGTVTTILPRGIPFITDAFNHPVHHQWKAGLSPMFEHIELFERALSYYFAEQAVSAPQKKPKKQAPVLLDPDLFTLPPAANVSVKSLKANEALSSLESIAHSPATSRKEKKLKKKLKRLIKTSKKASTEKRKKSVKIAPKSTPTPPPIVHTADAPMIDLDGPEEVIYRSGMYEPHQRNVKLPLRTEPIQLFEPRSTPRSLGQHQVHSWRTTSPKQRPIEHGATLLEREVAFRDEVIPSPSSGASLDSQLKLGDLLEVYEEVANISGQFFLCNSDAHKKLARVVDELNLSLREKYTFVMAPIKPEDALQLHYLEQFARAFSIGKDVDSPSIMEMVTYAEQTDPGRGRSGQFSPQDSAFGHLASYNRCATIDDEDFEENRRDLGSLTRSVTTSLQKARAALFSSQPEASVDQDPLSQARDHVHEEILAEARAAATWIQKDASKRRESSHQRGGIPHAPEVPIHRWEQMYKVIELYLWLSYRFDGFVQVERALKTKVVIEAEIAQLLDTIPRHYLGLDAETYMEARTDDAEKNYRQRRRRRRYYDQNEDDFALTPTRPTMIRTFSSPKISKLRRAAAKASDAKLTARRLRKNVL